MALASFLPHRDVVVWHIGVVVVVRVFLWGVNVNDRMDVMLLRRYISNNGFHGVYFILYVDILRFLNAAREVVYFVMEKVSWLFLPICRTSDSHWIPFAEKR